ncbi:MAG: hypothetical protein ACKOCN_09170 [Planctomycetaceae bacterium]
MNEPVRMQAVAVSFDCTPLRGFGRLDIPIDASPAFRHRLERLQRAVTRHGTRNSYYLTDALCRFQLTNDPAIGMVEFTVEGTVLTDDRDSRTVGSDLVITLARETCDWLTEPAVKWLTLSAKRAVEVEFDRYIAAGDLSRTLERLAREQAAIDSSGGFLGMNL